MGNKYVYTFKEGNKDMKFILGGKGANLAEMTKIGLPVPQGFTISTEACNDYYMSEKQIRDEIKQEINAKLNELEAELGKTLGSNTNPLLLSVRSGAVFSMPGMMDTILNLGLNETSVVALAKATNNERFAYDSYRRFIQMFSDVAMEIPKYKFENVLSKVKKENNYQSDTDLTTDDLKEIVREFKNIYSKEINQEFPQDPKEQLLLAIEAVFRSWNNPRAIIYRKLNDIAHNLGTAVNIQSMVFGNMGETSGTGVAFTRNPSTGENKLFGEFLMNAQGEDVVAGIRTPQHIDSLKEVMPEAYFEFVKTTEILENHYKDMQDIEFTIENEKLYILQTRNGKRTAQAAINIAVELVEDNIIDEKEAIMRVEPKQLDQLLHPTFDKESLDSAKVLGQGLPASPGASTGRIYFNTEDVVEAKKRNEEVILVRVETSPEDIEAMVEACGILTARGGMTSHAAVVARGMGKCCVSGCSEIHIDEEEKVMIINDVYVKEGEYISLDGSTGKIYLGEVNKTSFELTGNFQKLMTWVDKYRTMKIRTNADNERDAKVAMNFGAEGIGLCRTEHMFFEEERIHEVRKMILSNSLDERLNSLNNILDMQKEDFVKIFKVMDGKEVNIRLLDPPLHEFLPHDDEAIKELAQSMNINEKEVRRRINDRKEFNPMLGHRGCRLAITYPEIYQMQARAITLGAIEAIKSGVKVTPEIMIPLVGEATELKVIRESVNNVVVEELRNANIEMNYTIGTMIEVPRACVTADEIANYADFFSFGTNDLTQMTYGYSRDDSGKFLSEYVDGGVLEKDPFQVIDSKGVGKLVKIAAKLGRSVKNNIKLGVCGEHGGDPTSIKLFQSVGLNYVSCSPFRVPIARLSAAQAAILQEELVVNEA